ncbi:MAG: type II toxin-antitoxin system RelB/DinJ family antitoxin [Bacteroidetes bacterium]|nr:type II toxin-antitoxin system RelB/DinJ family antitoxin [Bacteroidota bacterium]MBU1677818.1 type II toxin-antitoxin system RelB/DinJ family antitoxin [Bacteroidota bacterium]
MAIKTATVRARLDPELKKKAEKIFEIIGLTESEAVRLFYKNVVLTRGLPFTLSIPNDETKIAIEEARRGEFSINHDSIDNLFLDLKS